MSEKWLDRKEKWLKIGKNYIEFELCESIFFLINNIIVQYIALSRPLVL